MAALSFVRIVVTAFLSKKFKKTGAYITQVNIESYSHNPEATATNAKEIFDIYKLYQGERLEKVRRRLKSEHSVLEIGSSSGQFLYNIVGECSLIHAIELDTECAEFSRKLGIDTSCQILESEFSANQYDIIRSFQVLEHIEQPFDFLKGSCND